MSPVMLTEDKGGVSRRPRASPPRYPTANAPPPGRPCRNHHNERQPPRQSNDDDGQRFPCGTEGRIALFVLVTGRTPEAGRCARRQIFHVGVLELLGAKKGKRGKKRKRKKGARSAAFLSIIFARFKYCYVNECYYINTKLSLSHYHLLVCRTD